jgi:16S rRNA (uracil1498-N3)-methyltransferase
MTSRDCKAPRIYVDAPLRAGEAVRCTSDQANYLRNVLRLEAGSPVRVFNGRDGEWLARLEILGKRDCGLEPLEKIRAQEDGPAIDYLFAPLKRARLDYMVQKAVELGVARLCPVLTERTVAERVNLARMKANAIEAAEQCGILRIPEILPPEPLPRAVDKWDRLKPLVFCDEGADIQDPIAALTKLHPVRPLGLLIGPEGGFTEAERNLLLGQPFTLRLSLGPRVMRADTAAVAALALVNAVAGDWRP